MPFRSALSELEKRALGMAIVSFLGEIPAEHQAEIEAPLLAVIAKLDLKAAIAELTRTLKDTAESWKPQCGVTPGCTSENPCGQPGCANA